MCNVLLGKERERERVESSCTAGNIFCRYNVGTCMCASPNIPNILYTCMVLIFTCSYLVHVLTRWVGSLPPAHSAEHSSSICTYTYEMHVLMPTEVPLAACFAGGHYCFHQSHDTCVHTHTALLETTVNQLLVHILAGERVQRTRILQ